MYSLQIKMFREYNEDKQHMAYMMPVKTIYMKTQQYVQDDQPIHLFPPPQVVVPH